ncbi:MAG: hypothetical protein GXO32_01830 [Crenarchaeota archaeon]|nr:hypothetical protein [Thermoproteota archaeon]
MLSIATLTIVYSVKQFVGGELYRAHYFLIINGSRRIVVACSMKPSWTYEYIAKLPSGQLITVRIVSLFRGCRSIPPHVIVPHIDGTLNVTGLRVVVKHGIPSVVPSK